MEIRSIGHNLTSVLMNPRESLYEEIMEDLWEDITSEHSPFATSTSNNSIHGIGNGDSLATLGTNGSAAKFYPVPSGATANAVSNQVAADESMQYLRKSYQQFALIRKPKRTLLHDRNDIEGPSSSSSPFNRPAG